MKKIVFLYGLWLLAIVPVTVRAQDSTAAYRIWSLDDCLRYAEDHSYSINSLKLTKETNRQNYLQSRSAIAPNLQASSSINVNHTGTDFGPDQQFNTNGSAGINSGITVYNGGYLQADIQQKKLSIASADLSIQQGRNNVNLQITQAYLSILLDKETIHYNEDLVKTSEAQLEQMQQKYTVGSAAKKDVIQIQAQLASDRYNLATAKSSERLDKLTLKQLLLLPADTTFDIQKPDTLFSLTLLAPLKEVQDIAANTLPDVRISELAMQSSRLDLPKARSGYLPVLSVSAGAGTSLGNTTNYSLGYSLSNSFYQQAGVSLSIPIFSRRVNKSNVERARISMRQAALDLENTKVGLSQTVEKAYLNALNSQNQYASALQQLQYNEEALRISNESLRIGAVNIVAYIQQRNLYVQALQQFTQAKYNTAMYLKIYEFYKGAPLSLD